MKTPNEILQDPTASYWLKDALRQSLGRDPVDAVNDAEWLAEYLRSRLHSLMGAAASLAVLVASQFPADVYTAGQTSAPVCIEYCEARS